ncbi:MAG: hypothetical protein IT579_25495, partial [Verrucomicrobia subdivision 3 bacterium]|nr:hypothetical protein [Limisphaerales bacterium]
MAKETDKSRLDNQQLTPEVEARLEQMVQQRMEALAAKLQAPAVPSVLDDLPERLVEAERQVREQAVIVNQEAHSRAQRRLAVEQKLEEYDDKDTKPYILYSTELCPQQAPALAGHEFPKYILKKTGRNRPDVAEKKVAWLTDREAARIRMVAELKFMKVPVLDEQGQPVLDKRSSAPLQKAVPYSAFIR